MMHIDDETLVELESLATTAKAALPLSHDPGIASKNYVDAADGSFRLGIQSIHPDDGREVDSEGLALFIVEACNRAGDLAADLREARRQLEACRAWAMHPEVTGALQLAWLHGWRESKEYQALCRATEEHDA